MKLKMWGTRGSIPRAISERNFKDSLDFYCQKAIDKGLSTISELKKSIYDNSLDGVHIYGGNTTCNEIITGKHHFFVDMGSGLADASSKTMKESRTHHDIFLTHMHWDHIMGLPFFMPIYMPGNTITIYHVHANAPEHVKILFNGVNFPVKWDQLSATINFKRLKLYETIEFSDVKVSSFALDHPGGSFGYRFDSNDGKSIAIAVDGEFKRITKKDLGKDLKAYQNLDLLVFDAQYELDELASRHDWGHCSPPIGVDLALREGVKNLILTHHDPMSDNQKSEKMLRQAKEHLKESNDRSIEKAKELNILLGYDGLELDLNDKS